MIRQPGPWQQWIVYFLLTSKSSEIVCHWQEMSEIWVLAFARPPPGLSPDVINAQRRLLICEMERDLRHLVSDPDLPRLWSETSLRKMIKDMLAQKTE